MSTDFFKSTTDSLNYLPVPVWLFANADDGYFENPKLRSNFSHIDPAILLDFENTFANHSEDSD